MSLFDTILVQPFVNILVLIYSLVPFHDFGVAIILLTLLVRAILWPLQSQTMKSQKALTALQPEIKKLSEKYKNDPQKIQAMTLELYKEKEVNPLSSCLPSLIQLPLMIALYYSIIKFSEPAFISLVSKDAGIWHYLYGWVDGLGFVKTALTGSFNTTFLGFFDLSRKAIASTSPLLINKEIVFAVVAAVAQFFQMRQMIPKNQEQNQSAQTLGMLSYMMPLMILYIGLIWPAALPLYWTVTTAVAYLQQWLSMREDVVELDKEAAIEVAAETKAVKKPKAKTKKK
jgi:YidC/Oxa1 family membrane protein insertase